MSKPIINLDMDGVFANFVGTYYNILRTEYPWAVSWFPPESELLTYFVTESVLDKRAIEIDRQIINHVKMFEDIEPFDGVLAGMTYLKHLAHECEVEVNICTAPHTSNLNCYSQKANWINIHLGHSWLNNLHLTRDKTLIKGTVLVDDKPEPLGRHQPDWVHVLFTRSYNHDVVDKVRMTDWSMASIDKLVEFTIKLHKEKHRQL